MCRCGDRRHALFQKNRGNTPLELNLQFQIKVQVLANRNVDGSLQTGAVFLDVAKAFDIVWVKDLLYKLPAMIVASYFVLPS
jgi:hypothetical protein